MKSINIIYNVKKIVKKIMLFDIIIEIIGEIKLVKINLIKIGLY